METKLEQIAVKAVNQLPKSVVREIRTPRSVGAGGGGPPPATRWAAGKGRPYPEHGDLQRLFAFRLAPTSSGRRVWRATMRHSDTRDGHCHAAARVHNA